MIAPRVGPAITRVPDANRTVRIPSGFDTVAMVDEPVIASAEVGQHFRGHQDATLSSWRPGTPR